MKYAILTAVLALAAMLSFPCEDFAAKGKEDLKLLKNEVKVPSRSFSEPAGDFASETAGASAAWICDQPAEPREEDKCIDCRRPYRERKELEERWKKAKREP